jgi:hypothetical protein
LSHSLSQIMAIRAKSSNTQKLMETEESPYFTEHFSQSSHFQGVAKMACFGFTVCPVWPLRYLSRQMKDWRASRSPEGFRGEGWSRRWESKPFPPWVYAMRNWR